MSTLAQVADVLRILNTDASLVDASVQAQIQDSLDGAEDYIKRILRYDPSAAVNGGTATFYDILETDDVLLPADNPTVTAVRVYFWPDSDPITLDSASEYTVDGSTVRLRPVTVTSPIPGAIAQRVDLYTYSMVQVDYTASANVPLAIRDAAAYLGAGMFKSGPRLVTGLVGERIGDYSYTTRQPVPPAAIAGSPINGPMDFWEAALMLIRPYIKRKPLVT